MSDEQQVKEGKVLKFGVAQLNNETPAFMKYIFRTIAFISGVWALLPQDLLCLDDHHYARANKWILLANTLLLFAIKFFGWDEKNNH